MSRSPDNDFLTIEAQAEENASTLPEVDDFIQKSTMVALGQIASFGREVYKTDLIAKSRIRIFEASLERLRNNEVLVDGIASSETGVSYRHLYPDLTPGTYHYLRLAERLADQHLLYGFYDVDLPHQTPLLHTVTSFRVDYSKSNLSY